MKRPSFQFYPGDWLHNPELRMCSLPARGLWIDMLCYMHQGTPYGFLKVRDKVILPDNLARMVGSTINEVESLLRELEEAQVFSRDEDGCIFSRRMIEDEKIRQSRAAGGVKGGNPALLEVQKGKTKVQKRLTSEDNHEANLEPTPSSSSSSSTALSKTNDEEEKAPPISATSNGQPATVASVEDYLKGRTQQLVLGGAALRAVEEWIELTAGDMEPIKAGVDAGLEQFQKENPGRLPRDARFYSGWVYKAWDRMQGGANRGDRRTGAGTTNAAGEAPQSWTETRRGSSGAGSTRRRPEEPSLNGLSL